MIALALLLLILVTAYEAWIALQTARDLRSAQKSVEAFTDAVDSGDLAARDRAVEDLQDYARSARERTDGPWWGAVTLVPGISDDARGVRALSKSLDLVAADGIPPFVSAVDNLEAVSAGGRIDTDLLRQMGPVTASAHDAFDSAADLVLDQDSSGFVAPFASEYDQYTDLVDDLASGLGSAEKAVEVLPAMVGADGPRDYLLVFQNNAEVRATGGIPGSWALVHAENGKLSMERQGSDSDFAVPRGPVLPLTAEEDAVYGDALGRFFQDPGFTPDFPRAARLIEAHWAQLAPDVPLDGVLAIDPVGMSYLLNGTGDVPVGNVTLTADNAADALLNQIYLSIPDPADQDDAFQLAAKAIFEAVTGDTPPAPLELVRGLRQAALEDRFLVAPFHEDEQAALEDTEVLGGLATEQTVGESATPFVDVGVNDATGAKMSYYLRYRVDVRAERCSGAVQDLAGDMTLRQTIGEGEAQALPRYVNGGGVYGTPPGGQFVVVRVYGPIGGSIDTLTIDGVPVDDLEVLSQDGRPVLVVPVEIRDTDGSELEWTMTTGPGQDEDGLVGVTPGVEPGSTSSTFSSAC